MTRYDWSKAPEWAQWAATDEDGRGYWYEHQPFIVGRRWLPVGRAARIDGNVDYYNWRDSLECRPEAAE